jgi:hypothetical protein
MDILQHSLEVASRVHEVSRHGATAVQSQDGASTHSFHALQGTKGLWRERERERERESKVLILKKVPLRAGN